MSGDTSVGLAAFNLLPIRTVFTSSGLSCPVLVGTFWQYKMGLFDQLDPPEIPEDIRNDFEKMALAIHAKGHERYSARTIVEHMRWHAHHDKGDRDFKLNDHWTPILSRYVMRRHPQLEGFFELRKSKYD